MSPCAAGLRALEISCAAGQCFPEKKSILRGGYVLPRLCAVAVGLFVAILRVMKDASKVPVPGQTMDVDLSEGEDAVVVPPKKKEPRAELSGSPSK